MKRTTLTVHAGLSVLAVCLVLAGLALASASACAEERIELSEEHLAAVNRQRRTIVNYEGGFILAPFVCKGVEVDELMKRHFSFLDKGKPFIDSVWWCFDNGNEAIYPSKILPPYKFRKFQQWHAKGVDFVRAYLEETRKRGLETFISYRANGVDIAYHQALRNAPAGCEIEISGKIEMLPMKKAHPDWLIRTWKEALDPDGYIYLWNYAQQGVRDYKLAILREMAENYDLDGIELDFCRTPPFLPLGRQWDQRDKLTDFVRSVRLMMLEVEKRRGRPLLLACRVPDSLRVARMDGFDLDTWASELLVDIFVPGSRSLDYDMAGFRRITRGTPIKVYPCLEGHHTSDGYSNPPIEVTRGAVANWWSQGADGIQTMNYCARNRVPGPYGEICSPETLKDKDKDFVVQRRGGGGVSRDIWPSPDDWYTPTWSYCNTNMFSPLPATMAKKSNVDTLLPLYVADDVNADGDRVKSITLHVLLSDAAAIKEQIEASINGVLLGRPSVEQGWLVFKLQPKQLAKGENIVGLRVKEWPPEAQEEIRIQKLEVRVRYRKGGRVS